MNLNFNQRIVIFIVAFAFFIELLDTTVINTSIPQIAQSFNVPALTIKIAITSYLIALAIFIPISGWLADKFGTKNIFLFAVVIFTCSSILCGFASSIYELALFRFLQGIGGALMIPIGRLIVLQEFANTDLLKVMSYISILALLGPIFGPVLGGYITTYYSWHWIFFINVPIGIIEFILAYKFIDNQTSTNINKFDLKGFILVSLGLALIAFSAENMSEQLLPQIVLWLMFIFGVFCIIYYIMQYKKNCPAILNLSLFKNKNFLVGNLQIFITIFTGGGVAFLLPILLQTQFHLNPLYSGIFSLPIAAGSFIVRFFIPILVKLLGYKKLLLINSLFLSSSLFMFSSISKLNYITLSIIGILYGVFYTVQLSCSVFIGYLSITPPDKSSATTLQSTNQQFALSICICINAFLLHIFSLNSGENFIIKNSVEPFQITFFIFAVLSVLNVLNARKIQI